MSSGYRIPIGWYIQKERQVVTRCPSYYAADSETLERQPGRYPLTVIFGLAGQTRPHDKQTVTAIDTIRIKGSLYSGFGGNNFRVDEMKPGVKVSEVVMGYPWYLHKMIREGQFEAHPEMADLIAEIFLGTDGHFETECNKHYQKPTRWDGMTHQEQHDDLRAWEVRGRFLMGVK